MTIKAGAVELLFSRSTIIYRGSNIAERILSFHTFRDCENARHACAAKRSESLAIAVIVGKLLTCISDGIAAGQIDKALLTSLTCGLSPLESVSLMREKVFPRESTSHRFPLNY